MAVDTADRLGAALADRYRIERELGQGGMATVYLAQDLRHDRRVAIKVLRPELSAVIGADRFLREIKTIAGLQHPHILGLIESGQADPSTSLGAGSPAGGQSFVYYVMPFVEGESLRDRLRREKQLPITDAVRIAGEVASALDYAHRHGVIHRDIKPENILLHDGQALVADFGIALAVTSAGGTRMTETGMSLGTPHYMSPEQAMGEREITARSDVYALGCVLYEMLVGEPPFTGPTAQAIVAKVMTDEPRPPTQIRKTVPPGLEAVTLTALAKLPADRFASAAAFGDALRQPGFESTALAQPRLREGRVYGRPALWAVGGMVAGALAAGVLFQARRSTQAGEVQRHQVTFSGRAGAPAISPDGRFVAYVESPCPEATGTKSCANLVVQEVGTTQPVVILAGAERFQPPRWNHDGTTLVIAGVLGDGRSGLFSLPRLGGPPLRLADEPLAYDTHAAADTIAVVAQVDSGATLRFLTIAPGGNPSPPFRLTVVPLDLAWSPDGRFLAMTTESELHLVGGEDGRTRSTLQSRLRNAPRWSVDGRHVLFFRWTAGHEDDLVAVPMRADGRFGSPKLLVSLLPTLLRGMFDVARSTGRVVVGSGSEFYDIWSFDLSTPEAKARRVTQGTSWQGPPFLTADGRILYYLRADAVGNSLYRMVEGRDEALTAERQIVSNSLRLSPDEMVVSFESIDSGPVLKLYDVRSGTTRQLARGQDDLGWVLPGGREILWRSLSAMWITDASGEHRRELPGVLSSQSPVMSTRWADQVLFTGAWFLAPDGRSVAVLRGTADSAFLVRASLAGPGTTTIGKYDRNESEVALAAWSSDGTMYLARGNGLGPTTLLGLDQVTGRIRSSITLPAPCAAGGVSVAPLGRRAACVVNERRADVIILDGLKP